MSSDLIPLAEAAKMLGMSAEKLTELRNSNEIYGYRDGSSWKFKQSELERFADDQGIVLAASDAGDDFSLSDSNVGEKSDLISDLDTPVETDPSSGSGMLSDSEDMLLSDSNGDDLILADSGDELELGGAGLEDSATELSLADSGELNFGESDISLASKLDDDSVVDEPSADGGASDTGKSLGDDLELADDDLFEDNELSLQDSVNLDDGSDLSSDFVDSSDVIIDDSDSNAPAGDDLILDEEDLVVSQGADDDDDFALSDSDLLNLDDDIADDFDLEPVNESLEDQSSSSQVIALEDSELMDDSNATMMMDNASGDLVSDEFGNSDAMPLETYDATGNEMQYEDDMVTVPAEPPYSIAQIAALGSTAVMMVLLVVLTLNLAQNMWQPADSGFTSTVANWIANDVLGFE